MLVEKKEPVREYELTYLVGTGYTTAEMNSIQDEIVSLLGRGDGEIVETVDWGKKTLAYHIVKDGRTHTEAVYTHMVVKLPASRVRTVARDIELKKPILRSLLVAKSEKLAKQEKNASQKAA